MNAALYSAFLGMRARQRALDATASNIANSSTAGFKAERVLYSSIQAAEADARRSQGNQNGANPLSSITSTANNANATTPAQANGTFSPAGIDARSAGVMTSGTTDFSAGAIRETGRPLDVA